MRLVSAAALVGAVLIAGSSGDSLASAGAPPGLTRGGAAASSVRLTPVNGSAAATDWCGAPATADRTPNTVSGNAVHWVYAIPSDGADRLATVATLMQGDAEQIDAWWRGQDSVRTPRNDVASFPCGSQLDVTTLRVPRTSAQLEPRAGRFATVASLLQQAGLGSAFTKYIVYYDGPVSDPDVCGQGGSDASGSGAAVAYLQSCTGVSTAAIAAHELLHTLGAVSTRAPHACTGDSSGHTCDTQQDLMFAAIAAGELLSSKLLDPGRDDYYGHSGGWVDTQDSPWLVRLDAQVPFALTISGPGSVSADVPGLQCAASCTTTWNSGLRLSLRATPSVGAKLVRWSGGCTGAGACGVTVGSGAAVSALFGPAAFPLRLAVSGKGAVRSSRAGITCRPRCSASFPSFVPLTLTASPAKGWRFRTWSGACHGKRATCTVPMSAATSARATFSRARTL